MASPPPPSPRPRKAPPPLRSDGPQESADGGPRSTRAAVASPEHRRRTRASSPRQPTPPLRSDGPQESADGRPRSTRAAVASPEHRRRTRASSPRQPTPPPRSGSPESADGRYPRRSTRAEVLTSKQRGQTLASPPQSRPSGAARRNPRRSTRAALTPSHRISNPAVATPPPSVPPTPPLPSPTAPPLETTRGKESYESGSEDNDKLMKINMEELHTSLDTLGVSLEERNKIVNAVSKRCMDVYMRAVGHEKGRCLSMAKEISMLKSQYDEMCTVLGEKDVFYSEEFLRSASLTEIHKSLTRDVMRLDVFKKQRLKNLQRMQSRIIDLWDDLGVTIEQQKEYSYMMRNTVAAVNEVTEKDALSANLLMKMDAEIKRLESLSNVTETDILERAEAIFSSQRDSSSRSEATVKNLINRVKVWEAKNETKFKYDKQELMRLLQPLVDAIPSLDAAAGGVRDDAAGGERDHSPTWSDSLAEGSEDSGSDNESQDPNYTASESEEES